MRCGVAIAASRDVGMHNLKMQGKHPFRSFVEDPAKISHLIVVPSIRV